MSSRALFRAIAAFGILSAVGCAGASDGSGTASRATASRARPPVENARAPEPAAVDSASDPLGEIASLTYSDDVTVAEGNTIALSAMATSSFTHPGILVDKATLDFVKAKIAVGAAPWSGALARARSSQNGSLSYTPHPRVGCGSAPNSGDCSDEKTDAAAAYTQALLWYYTGNTAYAKNVVKILDAYSAAFSGDASSSGLLQSAWAAEVFPRAAEIVRYTYGGWPASDVARYEALLKNAYLPKMTGGNPSNDNSALARIEATMNIAIFSNDKGAFQTAVATWRKRIPSYFDGLRWETCRDLGHMQYGVASLIDAAITARVQGINLLSEQSRRIRTALELNASYLNHDGTQTVCKLGSASADHGTEWATLTRSQIGDAGL
jgi:hypothetical protein